MKRTVTEIFIEVEEIVAVQMKGKSANAGSDLNHLTNNQRGLRVWQAGDSENYCRKI